MSTMEQTNLSTPALNARNIFTCRLSDNQVLLYAPLAGSAAIISEDEVSRLEDSAAKGDQDEDLATLSQRDADILEIAGPDTVSELSVLINQRCNFSCSYCYSAKGRSNTTLQYDVLDKALEYFIDPQRLKERHLSLSFIGGGEPLLSWPLVKHGIEYADFLASRYGFSLFMTITTNGSIMNDSIMDVLSQYGVLPNISFDILEEAQNKFKFIKSSDRVLDVGCSPGSFSQYMLNKILKTGSVVGVDILPNSFAHQRFKFILGDIKEIDISAFDDILFDVVVSDAMPNTTSDKETNHFRSISLCRSIFELAKDVLKDGGHFFIKVFDGKDLQDFKKELNEYFESVNVFKPKSSRDESREVFLFCKNFKKLR